MVEVEEQLDLGKVIEKAKKGDKRRIVRERLFRLKLDEV